MRINEKVAHLKEHHFSEWLRVRKEVDERVSRSFSMMCICGRLCTGMHERSCKRFQAKVDSETVKELKHLLDQKIEKTLSESDLGQWFTYIDGTGSEEKGKLKNFNNETRIAWIVYKCNENWDGDHWKDYTAQATNYSDIKELR